MSTQIDNPQKDILLEEHPGNTTHVLLFLDEDFEVLVDNGNSEQDTCSTANRT